MRKKKKFRRKEDPIKKILKINNKAYMRQKKMNEIRRLVEMEKANEKGYN